MTVSVTMIDSRMGEDGDIWTAGTTHDATEGFAKHLVQYGWATASFDDTTGFTTARAFVSADDEFQLLDHLGGVVALSEIIPEVTPTASATTNYSSKTAYAGYRCTTAAGNITITCVTSSKVLVPTTALALGAFPAYGAGHPGRIAIESGDGDVRVVLSGASVVYVGLEP